MALPSTLYIPPQPTLPQTFGHAIMIVPGDPSIAIEIQRASDATGTGATTIRTGLYLPKGGGIYLDQRVNDTSPWFYRARHADNGYDAGPYTTPWVGGPVAFVPTKILPPTVVGPTLYPVVRKQIMDDGQYAVVATDPLGVDASRTVGITGQNRTLMQGLTYLVPNAEFDIWETANQPHAWDVDTGDSSSCAKDTTTVFSGDASAKYSFGSGGSAGTYRGLATDDPTVGGYCIPLKPSVSYRVKISVRCSSVAGTPDYRIRFIHDGGGTLVSSRTILFAAASTWQTDDFLFTVPAGASKNSQLIIDFKRGNTSAQDFWIDALRMDEVGLSANPVVDLSTKSSAFTVDLSVSDSQQVILAGSILPMTFIRPVDGGRYRLAFQQDTTGSRLLPIHADTVMWVNDTAPTLSTAPGAIDLIEYAYRASPTPRYTGIVLAQNLQLPSPRVQDEGGQAFTTQTMTHNVNLSGAVNAGDLLLILFGTDSAQGTTPPTTPAGWTQIATQTWNNQNIITVLGKIADGTEGSTSVNVATSANCRAESIRYRIDRWYGSLAGVVKGGGATGTSTTPDPGSLTPGWTDRSLWLAVAGSDANTSVSTPPTNYTTPIGGSSTGTPVVAVFSGRRTLYATAEDPGAYTLAASSNWAAFTLAIRPPA